MKLRTIVCTMIGVAIAAPALAAPIEVTSKAFAEKREAATDGTTRISLVPAARVTPGDRVVYQLSYRNTGSQPVSDLVLSNPVPADMAYVAPASGSPAPEVSVDGTAFGPLAMLRVKTPSGGVRAATAADVRVVRWHLAQPVAPGVEGKVAFQAVLK